MDKDMDKDKDKDKEENTVLIYKELEPSSGNFRVPGTLTETGWIPPEGKSLQYEVWEAIGIQFQRINKAILWWIGDWLNYGEKHYGETYAQAIEQTEYKYQTLANAKWVASRVEFSLRRENVPYSHHLLVAPLEPENQKHYLDMAESMGMTGKALAQMIKSDKNLEELEGEGEDLIECPTCKGKGKVKRENEMKGRK